MRDVHEPMGAVAWQPSPISALRAFEAAARTLSFTKAAEELRLTQSAVSHAIHDIEGRLGAALFRRNGRRLELTEAGQRYEPFVREALAKLRAGDFAVTDPARRDRVLTVSVSPSFAAKWLAPRVGEFAALHPDLDLRISASAQHVDFVDDDIDLAVRHGEGNWPSLACVQLCSEWQAPVCRPGFINRKIAPGELLKFPLIHHRDTLSWRRWFEMAGVAAGSEIERGLTFSELSHAIDAAAAGKGVALARSALAARDLIAGRLFCPSEMRQDAQFGYWIVRPKDRAKSRKVGRFIDWLRREAAADEKALAAILGGPG